MGKMILPWSWQGLAKRLPTPRTTSRTHQRGTSLSISTLVVLKPEVPLPKNEEQTSLIHEQNVLTILK